MNYQEAISQSSDELLQLERQTKDLKARDRVRFIRLLKTNQATTQKQAGTLIGIRVQQSQRLWKQYREEGIRAISESRYQGSVPKLSPNQQQLLKERLKEDDVESLESAREVLANEFGVNYTVSGVSYLFKRLKIKLKTGRPQNIKQNAEQREEFEKKNTRN